MQNLFNRAKAKADSAWLMVDADLRACGSSAEWRRLQFPGGSTQTRERIDKLFPASDIAGHVLDVLSSGLQSDNVLVRLRGGDAERYLCACLRPSPSSAKPKKVRIEASEMNAYLVLDGETGEILETNEVAKTVLGETTRLPGESSWLPSVRDAARTGSHYLGRFKHHRPDGREVELEAILALVEDTENNK